MSEGFGEAKKAIKKKGTRKEVRGGCSTVCASIATAYSCGIFSDKLLA
jgi:hypothetical protein